MPLHSPYCTAGLSEVLRKHTFVGMADETLALLQHSTHLYLLNIANLSKDMFYQQVCLLILSHPSAFALSLTLHGAVETYQTIEA